MWSPPPYSWRLPLETQRPSAYPAWRSSRSTPLALRTPGRWPLALAAIPSVLVVSALLYFAETALECPGECSSYGEAMGAVVTASLIALVLSTIALLVREAWLLRRRTTVRDDRGP